MRSIVGPSSIQKVKRTSVTDFSPRGSIDHDLPPTSLEGIRRKVMLTMHVVERETTKFRDYFLKNVQPLDPANWMTTLYSISRRTGVRTAALHDFKDLQPLLDKVKYDHDVSGSTEFMEIREICERGRAFDYLAFNVRNELESAHLNLLRKYCLSFAHEAEGHGLRVVKDYETSIQEWDAEIKERMQLLDHVLDKGDRYGSPFSRYVDKYPDVLNLMAETCKIMSGINEPIKKWVVSDAFYARRIQGEINLYVKKVMDIKDTIKQMMFSSDQMKVKYKRQSFDAYKVERIISERREQEREIKRRQQNAMDIIQSVRQQISNKTDEIQRTRRKVKNRKENSATVYNYLIGKVESLREDNRHLEKKVASAQEELKSLSHDEERCHHRLDELSRQLDGIYRDRELSVTRSQRIDAEVDELSKGLQGIEEQIAILKKIREIKLHTDTVRKLHRYGYNLGDTEDYKDMFRESFQLVAAEIGRDWTMLYHSLPFSPPRDANVRRKDLQILDMSSPRIDNANNSLAVRSLEKWRRTSRQASILELVKSLKKINRNDIAKRIEKQLIVSSQQF